MSIKTKRWNRWLLGGVGALTAAAATGNGLCADNSAAILDALVKKGVLTQQEAEAIQAETVTNTPPSAESKWQLNSAIKNIGLYGDLRFRYEYRGVDNPTAAGLTAGDTYRRERFRYALRLGLRGDLYDNWNYGLRLETSTNPRSPWNTFADDSNPTPSAKNSDGINVGQVYLGWKPTDWLELTVGKMPNPLYTTPMVWDSDINPEGAFEKLKFSPSDHVDLFAGFGQFMYQDANPDSVVPSADTFMLAWQVGMLVKPNKEMSFKIAPVVYT